jgi:hypothetical protein
MYIEELKCCISEQPDHFVFDMKIMSCGHPVCSKCIGECCTAICKACRKTNTLDLNKISISFMNKIANDIFEKDLIAFSNYVYDNLENSMSNFKSKWFMLIEKRPRAI